MDEALEVGQQLAFGIAHLESLGILCGPGLTSRGVLKGRDGFWKIGDLSNCQRFPAYSSSWQPSSNQAAPPEVGVGLDEEITPAADVWMLGRLIAEVAIEGCSSSPSESLAGHGGNAEPLIPPQGLLQPLLARLWLLLHWLLTTVPAERPSAGEVAALLGQTLSHMLPHEILADMPAAACERALSTATAAARQLALEAATVGAIGGAARGALIDRLAGAPLSEMQEALAETAAADELRSLCANCGLDGRHVEKHSHAKSLHTDKSSLSPVPPLAEELSTDAESLREGDPDGEIFSTDSECAAPSIAAAAPASLSAATADDRGDVDKLWDFLAEPGPAPTLPDLIELDNMPDSATSPF
jgi:hypothetical protein